MYKIATAAVAGVLLMPAVSSTAAGAATDSPVIASYDGYTINLAVSWQTAHACVVLSSTDTRCFDTEAEMRDSLTAAALQAAPRRNATPFACGGSGLFVTLYADTAMGGNSLSFASTSSWSNLAPFGFDNDMESWVNDTGCAATVAENTGGGGAQLSLAAHSSASTVGTSWKNRASSIKVLP